MATTDDIIERVIDLRIQKAQLDQELQALKPDFFAACLALGQDTIERERAVIKRRLTQGKWNYDQEILEQQRLIKALKLQFQNDHDPIQGREVVWMVKLLIAPS